MDTFKDALAASLIWADTISEQILQLCLENMIESVCIKIIMLGIKSKNNGVCLALGKSFLLIDQKNVYVSSFESRYLF